MSGVSRIRVEQCIVWIGASRCRAIGPAEYFCMSMAHHGVRQSQVASDVETLGAQQLDLVVDAAAVVADGPVGFDYAMTRHEDWNRIRRHRGADCTLCVRMSSRRSQSLVSDHRARRDLSQQRVRAALEVALDQA